MRNKKIAWFNGRATRKLNKSKNERGHDPRQVQNF